MRPKKGIAPTGDPAGCRYLRKAIRRAAARSARVKLPWIAGCLRRSDDGECQHRRPGRGPQALGVVGSKLTREFASRLEQPEPLVPQIRSSFRSRAEPTGVSRRQMNSAALRWQLALCVAGEVHFEYHTGSLQFDVDCGSARQGA